MNRSSAQTITLAAHALYQASLFQADRHEVREYLRGVCLQSTPDGVIAVATDSHQLGAALSPSQKGAPRQQFDDIVLVVDAALRRSLRKKTAAKAIVELAADRKSATVTVTYDRPVDPATHRVDLIDRSYPDWRKIAADAATLRTVPEGEEVRGATLVPFAGEYAAIWEKVSVTHGKQASVHLHVVGSDGSRYTRAGVVGDCIVVRIGGEPNFLGILMPVTVGPAYPGGPVPGWAKAA